MSSNNPSPITNRLEKNSKDFFLLDVRTQEEFDQSHIPNSKLIPINEIPDNLEKIKQIKQPILIICRSGARAKTVQDFLSQNNITNTKVLEGGLLENSHLT